MNVEEWWPVFGLHEHLTYRSNNNVIQVETGKQIHSLSTRELTLISLIELYERPNHVIRFDFLKLSTNMFSFSLLQVTKVNATSSTSASSAVNTNSNNGPPSTNPVLNVNNSSNSCSSNSNNNIHVDSDSTLATTGKSFAYNRSIDWLIDSLIMITIVNMGNFEFLTITSKKKDK